MVIRTLNKEYVYDDAVHDDRTHRERVPQRKLVIHRRGREVRSPSGGSCGLCYRAFGTLR